VKDARQEVAEEIRKLKANIKFAQRAKEAATKIKTRINERREWMKKHREEVLKLRKE
jgi:methyl-accepting chemotaxis protein